MSLPFLQPYLGLSNSLQTTASGGAGWTFEDNFDGADNWTDIGTGTGVNVSTDKMDINWNAGSNNASAISIGTVNNTAFVFRMIALRASAQTNDSNVNIPIGMAYLSANNQSTAWSGSDDRLGMSMQWGSVAKHYSQEANDATSRTTQAVNYTWALSTDYFFETIRLSATSAKTIKYTTSSFTTEESSATLTIPSTITGLQYIKIQSIDIEGGGGGVITCTLSGVKFANGVTVAP